MPHPLGSTEAPDWAHRGRVFIEEDQPPLVKEENFQLLLQVLMEENCSRVEGSTAWMEPFLQRVSGYQNHHLIWSSGCVLQSVVVFDTAAALSWMRGAESLLQEAGLAQALGEGLTVQGVHVKNITVGGLQANVCDWLVECRAGFDCIPIGRNFTCRSACHAHFCHNHGICVHHRGQQPSCRCPVGDDF
ncbi:hypothetical protein AALO_G00089570 [Alosa alosa]|uniref:Uncharacterized protein n=1 Tax=Alosa alosa TaxID=278164 RepID=A0AAV6GW71_9TELE|nr:uncharacterized protein si:ch211-14k19.8 [Alosa alosa]KAG5277627.1 hypothetical protein AALO_G00089570 [Alosa alosa]